MSLETHEIEVKYAVANLTALEKRLKAIGAQLVQARIFESNLRFDDQAGSLGLTSRVLRLRLDTAARMTFKGPSVIEAGVRDRLEIEFVVSDFYAARSFLEALGYRVTMIYEKFRAVYNLGDVDVTLDELPYGNFVEIEGPDADSLRRVNQQLGLDWEAAVTQSYSEIFARLKELNGWDIRDLSFENFTEQEVHLQDLEIYPADHLINN